MFALQEYAATQHINPAMIIATPEPYLRIWWIFCAILVFLMQVGFMLVETGFVRERSMSGIALKTFLMLLASSLAYSVVGYHIMYGHDIFLGLVGWGTATHDLGLEWQFYQTGFAAVAATIISGAIAERTTLRINIVIAFIIGGLVYPVVGHWAWATDGWLHLIGYHDLAGSGVVHFLGGIASLAAAWITGPRLDKYNPTTTEISDYVGERSLPLVSCGVLFLWLGWMGFNGGSVKDADELQHAGFYIIATCCAASAGGFAIMVISPLWEFLVSHKDKTLTDLASLGKEFFSRGEVVRPFDILPATMGGMVAVTANSDLLLPYSYLLALPIGMCGGIAVFITSKILQSEFIFKLAKIDDPAEAIAVHAGAGAMGILIAAFFSFHGTPVLLHIQGLGLLAIGVFSFAIVAALFYLLNGRTRGLMSANSTNRVVEIFEYRAKTFEPEIEKRVQKDSDPRKREEVLGIVNPWFDINWVRSTPNEENVGLRFEPRSVRPAAFPLRTAFVAEELQSDVRDFLSALVSPLVHQLENLIRQLLKSDDFQREDKYHEVRNALLFQIDQMKAFAAQKLSSTPVLLGRMVNELSDEFARVHAFVRPTTTEREIDQKERFRVYAQHEMLENAVRALLSNAARAVFRRFDRNEPGYEPLVKCELYQDSHRVVLSVIDNGGGVPSDVADRLFEPFNKGHIDGGHGLGLFYAAEVAAAFSGRLVLVRNDRDETRFDLILYPFEEV
jgi:Amt family ammonium transporter